MRTETPKAVYRQDYKPPVFGVKDIELTFKIFEEKTIVLSKIEYERLENRPGPLFLNGEELKLIAIKKNGEALSDYTSNHEGLTIENPGDAFTLEIEVEIDPASNTALEGLYKSSGNYCTQCEAEGFRRITFFQDRPDVLANSFTVRIEADKTLYPVLLSNGDLIEEGDLEDGRHYTVWKDNTPKPCYLFALVAGKLVYIQDHFKTMSGNDVDLRIYVRPGDEDQCQHAMKSLIKSMKWDEDVYGREYQFSRFNIVAVSDFNMGAMENTSLNIFNTALVLAEQKTATDDNFIRVQEVIAHEYFHNWTGNRVTCRDWFQLSLKEGLTVFRDASFSADMTSAAARRIDDVSILRRMQFPEDAGPLAHPIRPDTYMAIDNFYTMTVYEKGSEVIRMFHTLLGPETYRKGTDLYFDRHDGQAVTCDDWFQAMQDVTDLDLSQFKLWYSYAGTPHVEASSEYDEGNQTFTLHMKQSIPDTPGQTDKKPMHIPVRIGLVGPNGEDMDLGNGETTTILHLKEAEQSFTFENIASKPVPSILRGFSAPVKLKTDHSKEDLAFLMVHDSDGFNRWDAGQNYSLNIIQDVLDHDSDVPKDYLDNFGALYDRALSEDEDKTLMARAISVPGFSEIAQRQDVVDPDAVHSAREKVVSALVEAHKDKLKALIESNKSDGSFSITPQAMGKRALKNTAMLYFTRAGKEDDVELLYGEFSNANNMTERLAAFKGLVDCNSEKREQAIEEFYNEFKDYQLVVDKWFTVQVSANRDDIFDQIAALRNHAEFNIKNPNRVRSLYAAFAMMNPVKFHQKDGSGYNFFKDFIMEYDKINPQVSARLLSPFREWRRFTPDRQEKMKSVLKAIADMPGVSPNTYEIASKSLAE